MSLRIKRSRLSRFSAVFMVAILLAGIQTASAQKRRRQQEPDTRLTQLALQTELMSFSDRLNESLSEALMALTGQLDSPAERVAVGREHLYVNTAAMENAASPNPAVGLLDMAVLLTLKRMSWEEHGSARFGDKAGVVVEAYREREADIWSLVAGVYTPEQQELLREIVDNWRAANPGHIKVAFFRLDELSESRKASILLEVARPGGMLAPIKETNRQIEEARLVAERALFMLVRMQLNINDQIRLAILEVAAQPEVQGLVGDASTLAGAAERASVTFKDLGARLSAERQAAIDHLFEEIHAEREDLLADLTLEGSDARQTMAEFRVAVESANTLAERVDAIVTSSRAFYERTEEVAAANPNSRPFDILEYHRTFEQGTRMAEELRQVVDGTERLFNSDLGQHMPHLLDALTKVGDEADKLAIRSFSVGLGLIVSFFVFLFIYRLAIARWITARLKSTPS